MAVGYCWTLAACSSRTIRPLWSRYIQVSKHRDCIHTAADWCLNFAGPCTTKGAVCVAEAGPLDLLLTMRNEEMAGSSDDKRPGLEVEFSGGQVRLMTCADSLVALRDIVLYLALDGASEISGCAEDAERQGTPPSVSGRLGRVPVCLSAAQSFSSCLLVCVCVFACVRVCTVLVIQCPSSVATD